MAVLGRGWAWSWACYNSELSETVGCLNSGNYLSMFNCFNPGNHRNRHVLLQALFGGVGSVP
jgi:hypothetical protein